MGGWGIQQDRQDIQRNNGRVHKYIIAMEKQCYILFCMCVLSVRVRACMYVWVHKDVGL
jgi:hypothetical protein